MSSFSIHSQANEYSSHREQRLQIKKDINKAMSLCSISPQSTFYVPIIDIPHQLPGYIHVDRHSEWQRSALISSALETVTLPSRLRSYHDFEASLVGGDGRRTIFELQSTINPKYDSQPASLNKEVLLAPEATFDIDFTYDGDIDDSSHIFNRVQVMRGSKPRDNPTFKVDDDPLTRRLRLYNSEPLLQR